MADIIDFPVKNKTHVTYNKTTGTDIAVQDFDLKIMSGFEGSSLEQVFISINGECIYTDRKRLAEFLWCAVHLVDGDARYQFDKYPCRDYE